MSKRITQTNEIQSGDNSGIVFSGDEKASYSQDFTLEEFDGRDLITLDAANELISGNDPIPTISVWEEGETAMLDDYRTHQIGDIEYLFRSTEDDNVSEPTLDSAEWKVIGAPGSGSSGTPTSGTLLSSDSPLVITWDTDLVPDDEEGRTYLEKHGPLEKVSIQVTMPDPTAPDPDDDPLMTVFPSWRFDDNTKNILTIDNQGQKLYYVIGFGADGNSSGGGGGSMTGAEIRAALGITTLSGNNTGDDAANATSNTYADGKVADNLTASTTVAPSKTAVNTALANKVDKDGAKVLSDENYTSAEKTKLSNLSNYFVGTFASYGALVAAHPTGLPGQYAVIDTIVEDARQYIWDDDNDDWVQGNTGAVLSWNGQTGAITADTDDLGEGSTNKYWTLARTVGALLTGYVAGTTNVAVAATDTIMQAIQKLSGSITAANTDIAGKEPAITAGTSAQFWLGNKTWGTIITTVLGVVLTGLSTATSTAVIATDTILVAIGKLQAQITLRATIASPTFTGTPAAPTASVGTNTTQLATMAAVYQAVTRLQGANVQTASYTLALSDAGKRVEMDVASGNNLTIPLNSAVAFPIDTQLVIRQIGAGQTTVVATSGVTIQSESNRLKFVGQYSIATLIKVGTDTWALDGGLTT